MSIKLSMAIVISIIVGIILFAVFISSKDNKARLSIDFKQKEISFELESKNSIKKDEPVYETDSSDNN